MGNGGRLHARLRGQMTTEPLQIECRARGVLQTLIHGAPYRQAGVCARFRSASGFLKRSCMSRWKAAATFFHHLLRVSCTPPHLPLHLHTARHSPSAAFVHGADGRSGRHNVSIVPKPHRIACRPLTLPRAMSHLNCILRGQRGERAVQW